MVGGIFAWVKRVGAATAVLTAVGLFADGTPASASTIGGADLPEAIHAGALVGLAWLLASLRIVTGAGLPRIRIELLSPRRVLVRSAARRARLQRSDADCVRQ